MSNCAMRAGGLFYSYLFPVAEGKHHPPVFIYPYAIHCGIPKLLDCRHTLPCLFIPVIMSGIFLLIFCLIHSLLRIVLYYLSNQAHHYFTALHPSDRACAGAPVHGAFQVVADGIPGLLQQPPSELRQS